jgi:hypothetical protein
MKILNTILVSIVLAISAGHTFAQGTTAFTYQGRLNAGANAANGSYDMTFAVYDANVSGNQIAGPITNSAVAVTNGLFTVSLDFGAGVFTGTNYWVQMNVSPAGANTFAALTPRQQLTPAPYALSLVSPQATALNPPGAVIAYMGTNAPNGWLMCDGSAISRTQYAALFAVIGTSSGYGDTTTTFNLPDLRGVFLRGVNGTRSDGNGDPDAANRPGPANGANGGNAVGSFQADQFKSHTHTGSREIGYAQGYNGSGIHGSEWTADTGRADGFITDATGGNETRPKNVYVNYIIKY